MRNLWKNYSLSITLATMFLVSWATQAVVQFFVLHDKAGKFWEATFENWQSEFLQLLTFVVLTTYLIHKDSGESKDSDERLEAKVDELLKRSE